MAFLGRRLRSHLSSTAESASHHASQCNDAECTRILRPSNPRRRIPKYGLSSKTHFKVSVSKAEFLV